MYEPTKQDKKILRKAIDGSLQKDYAAAINDLSKIIESWKKEQMDNEEAYTCIYKTLTEHDKWIAKMYDGIGGSQYPITVAGLFAQEKVAEADLEGLSEETMQRVMALKVMGS